MPLKIIPESEKAFVGGGIHKRTVQRMVQNFVDKTHKEKNSSIEKINATDDSRSIWFSKAEIDQLFLDNGFDGSNTKDFGLRIYFALHQNTKEENEELPKRPLSYINQHAAVLVCTKLDSNFIKKDCLKDGDAISVMDGDLGIDEGQICPPPPMGQICSDQGSALIIT